MKDRLYYDRVAFQEAKNKKELCEAATEGKGTVNETKDIEVSRDEEGELLIGIPLLSILRQENCARGRTQTISFCVQMKSRKIWDTRKCTLFIRNLRDS